MHVVPDGERLRFVYGRAVCRLESELQHGGLASGERNDFLSLLNIYEIDAVQEVMLRALIRRLVIEARLERLRRSRARCERACHRCQLPATS